MNPELILMRTRPESAVNLKAVAQQELRRVTNKARRCGMSLQGYCQRFGVRQIWNEVALEQHNSKTAQSATAARTSKR